MAEDYEAVYTHPSGAMAIFTRRGGSLDAVARGLDSEQFWVFKNVKALLVRNDEEDLADATRQMASIGFSARVRPLEPLAPGAAAPAPLPPPEEAHAAAHHEGPHAPAPSYWPLFTGLAAAVAMCGLIVVNSVPFIAPLGAIALFICMIGWGVEPFEA
ncbi:MAG TPA: hypothetical protein VGR57_04995 [Ktedonobacterales bacterium]|nr:hypothetical protein [Ktedonobacterales bacterium]